MGILEDLLRGAMAGQGSMRGPARQEPAPAGGDMSQILTALLPIVLSMLASRGSGAQQGGSGGGLADILGQVMGGGAPRRGGSAGGMDGLGSLLEQLQHAGFGDQARSWVGKGQNMPIPADAMEQIFGRGGVAEIARQAGVSEADASRGLSNLLPDVVDNVTPNGEVPDFDSLVSSVDDLSRRLGLA